MTAHARQLPFRGLPVAIPVTSDTGLNEVVGIADDRADGHLVMHTTHPAVVLTPQQAAVLAGELLARLPADTAIEPMAAAMFVADATYATDWLAAPAAVRLAYRLMARAAINTVRSHRQETR